MFNNKTDNFTKDLSPEQSTAELIRIIKDRFRSVEISKIEELIAQGADVNAKISDKSNWSILMSATTREAHKNTTAIIRCLVNNHADIHYNIAYDFSALSRAAIDKGIDVLQILYNEHTSQENLNSALQQSILNENTEASDFLLSKGAIITDINEELEDIDILQSSYQENEKLINAISKHQLTLFNPPKTIEIATRKGLEFSKDELKNLYPYIVDSYVSTKVTLIDSQEDLTFFATEYLQNPIIKKSLSQKTKLLLKLIFDPSSLETTTSEHLLTLKNAITTNEYFENNIAAQNTALFECLKYPISENSFSKKALDNLETRIDEEETYGQTLSQDQRDALWEITNPEPENNPPQKSSPSSIIKTEVVEAEKINNPHSLTRS